MVKDKYLYITTIYIEVAAKKENENDENKNKSYYYYNKEGEGLIKSELTKESFEKYLSALINRSKTNLNLVNLYLINGDINENDNNNINRFYFYSMKKVLGFEPIIKIDDIMQKVIFFIQNLSQAQILYHLYKQISNHQLNEIVVLINYTKYCGYQVAVYYDEEIILDLNQFQGLNREKTLDENIEIISKGINEIKKDVEEEKKIDIVLTQSIDDKENDITPVKIEEKLVEKLKLKENNKNNIQIIISTLEFNKELKINSHVFYLDN